MIRSVTIRRFKRFEEITFALKGRHIVLAGPIKWRQRFPAGADAAHFFKYTTIDSITFGRTRCPFACYSARFDLQ